MTIVIAVVSVISLYGIWMLATYVLEGRMRTFQRPNAAGTRLLYSIAANVLIGIVGAAFLIERVLQSPEVFPFTAYGLAEPTRTALMTLAGIALGTLALVGQKLPTWRPMVLTNAFAQVLVVSIAEVVVCWAFLGSTLRNIMGAGIVSVVIAIVLSAFAFGLYHFAHSPPFNTGRMVLMLSGVGILTGIFFFLGGDLYGTVIFHNTFAVRGVTEALSDAHKLQEYERMQLPLIGTALAAVLILVAVDATVMRPALHAALP
jgi:hypothetical protein